MKKESVYMGTMLTAWMQHKNIKYVTFSVTDDCNLMCEYCYFTHKNNKNKMPIDIAKKAIDYILSEKTFLFYDGVVWDFIGGEPTLEMDLIDEICDYILYKMYTTNHKWLNCYRIMIGTNGLLYDSPKFQKFLSKHNYNLHVNITVDGSKKKHDLSRIKKDGSGSYEDVVSILPLWFKQTGNISTKSTFAHADLPYLKESIINLWNLGFKNVMANVVFENVWQENDDIIYETQLKDLADYIIEHKIWNDVSVRFFSPSIGYPIGEQEKKLNFCGSGNMLAIDYKGDFYPCIRFMDSALNNKSGRIIGNIREGINKNKIRAFNALSYDVQNPQECINCDISAGCCWCTGFNYDCSESYTIFERQTFHCKMHKANVRANKYFWKKYEQATGLVSPLRYNMYTSDSIKNKYLYILQNNHFSYCNTDSSLQSYCEIDDITYKKAMDFCFENNYIPVHVGFKHLRDFGYYIGDYTSTYERNEMTMDVIKHSDVKNINGEISSIIIYRINFDEIEYILDDIKALINNRKISKINIVVVDYQKWTKQHLFRYKEILNALSSYIYDLWKTGNYIQINVITDNILLDHKVFCSAGSNSFTLAPNGKIYSCAAYYFDNRESLGTLYDFKHKQNTSSNLLMCKSCEVNNCNKCTYLNRIITDEAIVPFELHCVKANIELKSSALLLKKIEENTVTLPFDINRQIRESMCLDPLISLRGDTFSNDGLYKIK